MTSYSKRLFNFASYHSRWKVNHWSFIFC